MNNNSQRVNIQFSLDLDDLPSEVSRLFQRAASHSKNAAETFDTFSHQGEPLTVASLNKIDDIRLALTKADLVLDDLQKIIGGYIRMQAEPPPAAQEEAPQQESAPEQGPPMPEPSVLNQKNPFRQAMPDVGPNADFSLEELQNKVKQVVEAIQDEESVESALKGV